VHRFLFTADSRLQQTKHAAAFAAECFLKRPATARTVGDVRGGRLHLF
jgi:hypothetical protein